MTGEPFNHLDEAEILRIFEESGICEVGRTDEVRVEEIVERAIHEAVLGETTSFLFHSFTEVLSSFAALMDGDALENDEDYNV